MKNQFNETGTDFGKIINIVPKSKYQFSKIKDFHNEQEFELRKIKYPLATRELVKELLGLVNSEDEYNMLLKDLAELDAIKASQPLKLDSNKCCKEVTRKWMKI